MLALVAFRGRRVLLGLLEIPDRLVLLERQDLLELLVPPAQRDRQAQQGHKETKATLALLALVVSLALLVLLDPLVQRAILALREI
jgi:hypothetical protein